MKCRLLSILLVLTGSLQAPGQDGFIAHFDSIQAGRSGSGIAVREVEQGYLLFARQFAQDMPTRSRVFVRKLNELGLFLQEYEHRPGENRNFDIGYIDAVANAPDGTYIAALAEGYGYTGETWLYRFDTDGDTISRRFLMTYPITDSLTNAIRQTRRMVDGSILLCGFRQRSNDPTFALLVKVDPEGDTLWTRAFIQTNGSGMVALGVEEYVDGGVLLTGFRTGAAFNRSFLLRTDADGNELWRRYYGNVASQNGAVRVDPDGGIITWNNYKEPGTPLDEQEMMLTKWNAEGQVVWQRKMFYGYYCSTYDLEVLPDGDIICTGALGGSAKLLRFNSVGDLLWARDISILNSFHLLYDVESTSDGGFVCTGVAWRDPVFDPDIQQSQTIWVVKTDSLGCVVPGCQLVGVEEYVMDLNEHLRIWPNPVARGTPLQLSFTPPPEFMPNGPLRLVVLDALGRTVQEGALRGSAGQLTTDNLSNGLYHLSLTDNTRWLAGGKVVVE